MRGLALVACVASVVIPAFAQQQIVTDPPEVRGPFTLSAIYDAAAGHNAFVYAGKPAPPVIRVVPGDVIQLHYVNDLPAQSTEQCALARCANMTNLHFHGLHVSPDSPQDDVLTMMAKPGEALDYKVDVPSYAPPGLYWYHTHPHGESARQDLDGMSGAIVVEGIERYYPRLWIMRERVLILRDHNLEHDSPELRSQIARTVAVSPSRCGTATEQALERIFSLNGEVRPRIPVDPGERQFWRIVNASPDRYADLQLSGQNFEIVALDGMPLSYHNPTAAHARLTMFLSRPLGA